MIKVAGIRFFDKGRMYYFNKNNLNLKESQEVIVETERGLQYGFVYKSDKELQEKDLITPLKNVIRIATERDKQIYKKNLKDSSYALIKARNIAKELNLNMNIMDASYTFDRKQLLFNFTADDRIDFRNLAKRLASIYKTRIELRQIGIRDKAREIGGLGPCGRFLCCNSFLTDLNSVTINMAKNQMLALNPTKINGVCGRLLCCLAYEDDNYTYYKKDLPTVGEEYIYKDKPYKVVEVDILNRKIKIENPERNILEEVFIDYGSFE